MTEDSGVPGHIEVGYSHLFAGLELRPDRVAAEYEVEFVDGAVTRAEMVEGAGGDAALRVEAYRTAAGTDIAERVWALRDSAVGGFKLGRAL
ncbi:hypothetical protein ACFVUS_23665 [Nocardia sp. NPDC058058]|uniref:hypothetical protein n=1 Tax=Nocardia sp. NPDC058058 TaxID=3346317 RepID=UPI0036DB06BA